MVPTLSPILSTRLGSRGMPEASITGFMVCRTPRPSIITGSLPIPNACGMLMIVFRALPWEPRVGVR